LPLKQRFITCTCQRLGQKLVLAEVRVWTLQAVDTLAFRDLHSGHSTLWTAVQSCCVFSIGRLTGT